MVDLGKFESQVFKGKIINVQEISLREYLEQRHGAKAEGIIAQFNQENIDRPHVVLIISYDSSEIDWFGMIPKAQGWNKSNLKKVLDRNNLPVDTKKWVGKEIDLKVNTQGFLRVAV